MKELNVFLPNIPGDCDKREFLLKVTKHGYENYITLYKYS